MVNKHFTMFCAFCTVPKSKISLVVFFLLSDIIMGEANHTERMESTMTYNVKTEGMGCPRCMAKVTKAMEALGAEVKRMELNDFTVAYEGAPEAIRSAIEALGFRFISAEAE